MSRTAVKNGFTIVFPLGKVYLLSIFEHPNLHKYEVEGCRTFVFPGRIPNTILPFLLFQADHEYERQRLCLPIFTHANGLKS